VFSPPKKREGGEAKPLLSDSEVSGQVSRSQEIRVRGQVKVRSR